MNYYGFPPGYSPAPTKSEATDIPANVKRRADNAGATHLSKDGKQAYVKRFNNWYYAQWDGVNFGCWWLVEGDTPKDMVAL